MGLLKKGSNHTVVVDEAKLAELRKVDLFADLEESHLVRLSDLVEVRVTRAKEELVHEGSYAHEFFVIISGTADASVRGKKRMTLGPGEFFGELALVSHTQTATVVSEDEMRLGVIDAKAFKQLLEEEPSIAIHMVERLIFRLEDVISRPAGQML